MTRLLVLLFIPTKYESNPLKKKGNIQFWKKINQKVNLRRCPTPARQMPAHPDIAILKDWFFFKKPVQKGIPKLSPFAIWTDAIISSSYYLRLELISMVPKMFDPLKFNCTLIVWTYMQNWKPDSSVSTIAKDLHLYCLLRGMDMPSRE